MKNKADYSKYECPYSHLEKESGHELHSPEGYQDVYSVWCACGFRAPVFYLDPDELGLKLKNNIKEFPVIIRDKNGNLIYYEESNGYWIKREYDSNGNKIYYEDSDCKIIDNRPKQSFEGK